MKTGDTSPLIIIAILFVVAGFAYGPVSENGEKKNYQTSGSSELSYSSNKSAAENIEEVEDGIKRLESNIERTIEESKRSPYYGKIWMSGVSGMYGNEPDKEYINLYTSLEKDETINITGWRLKSETTGNYVTIGKAALLPFPYTKNESDVVLQQNDRVTLVKGFSPIGVSFRTNICTGYFEENRTFYPSLPLECPKVDEEDLPKFSNVFDRQDECLDLIDRVPRCSTISSRYLRDLPDTVTESCKNYLRTEFTYNTCVARNFGSTNFPGNDYRIYLNKFGPLWREKRERINLLDRAGLIVDTIEY